MRHISKTNSSGITLVEVIVAMTVMALLSGIFFNFMASFYQDTVVSIARNTQESDTIGALRSIESELTSSISFAATYDPGPPLGSGTNATDGTAWSHCGNSSCSTSDYRVLMGRTYTTDKPKSDPTRKIVLRNTIPCSSNDMAASRYAENTVIYFVTRDPNNSTINNLYRRTVVNTIAPTASLCSTPIQKTTCQPSRIGTTLPGGGTCQTTDALLLRNIKSFSIDYYNSSNDTAPYTTGQIYATGAAAAGRVTTAQSIQINVESAQSIRGTTPSKASLRFSLTP